MENVSCQDDILVKELRFALSDMIDESPLLSEYFYLHLWLKARNMKVKEAEKAIRNSWKWRKENDLIEIELDESDMELDFFDFLPWDVTGRDKSGAPVVQMLVGEFRASACIDIFGRDRFVRFMARSYWRCERLLLAYHRYLHETKNLTEQEQGALKNKGFTAILNFAHFSFKDCTSLAAIKAGLETTSIFGKYFCGHTSKMILVNVNPMVSRVVKPFLSLMSGVTIEIYNTDSSLWQPKFHSWVDPSQLLPSNGGSKPVQNMQDIFNFYAGQRKRGLNIRNSQAAANKYPQCTL